MSGGRLVRGGGNADPTIAALQRANDKHLALKRQVAMLRSSARRPTMPNYDMAAPLDAVQGQHALFDDGTMTGTLKPQYYTDADGWQPFGGVEITSSDDSLNVVDPDGPVTDLTVQQYFAYAYENAVTIPAGSNVTADWSVNNDFAGLEVPLKLTGGGTDTAPLWTRSGLAILQIVMNLENSDPALTPGTKIEAVCNTPITGIAPFVITTQATSVTFSDGTFSRPNTALGIGYASSGNDIEMTMFNTDAVDHSVYWQINVLLFVQQ